MTTFHLDNPEAGVGDGSRNRGRPLDRSRDTAILAAAMEILAEIGYDRLTMDLVAARARAGKAALYRRWPSKAELVVNALARHSPCMPEPDTGTLRGDLEAILVPPDNEDVFMTAVVAGLATACRRDPQLARAFREKFMENTNRVLRHVFERALERGEIPEERDLDLLIEITPALFFSRSLVTGMLPDEVHVRRMIAEVILPAATSCHPTAV